MGSLPDPDWYLDHVLATARPGGAPSGPVRQRQATWWVAAAELRRSSHPQLRRAVEVALGQGFVLNRAQAGLDVNTIRRLVRRREWSVPQPGLLSPLPPDVDGAGGLSFPVRSAAAVLARTGTAAAVDSAAAMHGLPLLTSPDRPTLVTSKYARKASQPNVTVGLAPSGGRELDGWFGCPLTSIARTVVDIGRHHGVAAALVAADAARYDGLVTLDDLRRARRRAAQWPGVGAAARAIGLSETLAESPLESLTRLCLIDGGLPVPELQVAIETDAGTFRVDHLYRACGVVVEADGELKYTDQRAVVKERRRDQALERARHRVVHVSWAEVVGRSEDVVARVRRAMSRDRW